MSPVISVQNLGKKYILSHQSQESYTALRDVMANGAKRLTRKLRHPFLVSQNDPTHEEFWAIKDVGFDIQQGNQPSATPQYPATSNPNPQPTYPATETTSYPSYPSQPTTTYPSSQPSASDYPSSPPSTNYPSGESTYYPPSQPTTRPTTTTRPTPPASRPQPTQPTSSGAGTYTVSQGETLWAISRKFNTTVDKLKALNGLSDNTIKPGQQLRVK